MSGPAFLASWSWDQLILEHVCVKFCLFSLNWCGFLAASSHNPKAYKLGHIATRNRSRRCDCVGLFVSMWAGPDLNQELLLGV